MITIKLKRGKVAFIDNKDWKRVSQYLWLLFYSHGSWYVRRNLRINGKRKTQFLHVFIMHPPLGKIIDHIDGNGLNCQRHNMRICTTSQNGMNRKINYNSTSGFKGVVVAKKGKWQANIKLNGKLIYLGTFKSKKKAARIYNKAAKKYFGQFAKLNKIT